MFPEPEIPDIQVEEEAVEGEGAEQAQGEPAGTTEDVEPQEQALGVSTPTGEEDTSRKGIRNNCALCIDPSHHSILNLV